MEGLFHHGWNVDMIAAHLCNRSRGDWSRPKTRKQLWRRRAMALIELSLGNETEARKIMRNPT